MEDPENLSRYLGCCHTIKVDGEKGSRMTRVVYDMCDYFASANEIYETNTGLTLKAAPTPYAPELPKDQLISLMEKDGRYGHHAASHLMKLSRLWLFISYG